MYHMYQIHVIHIMQLFLEPKIIQKTKLSIPLTPIITFEDDFLGRAFWQLHLKNVKGPSYKTQVINH
jgi:hypothetical protein